jgi:hypothetical protein
VHSISLNPDDVTIAVSVLSFPEVVAFDLPEIVALLSGSTMKLLEMPCQGVCGSRRRSGQSSDGDWPPRRVPSTIHVGIERKALPYRSISSKFRVSRGVTHCSARRAR